MGVPPSGRSKQDRVACGRYRDCPVGRWLSQRASPDVALRPAGAGDAAPNDRPTVQAMEEQGWAPDQR
ncbi:hypothetical protein NDU88_001451 [Pleurodeles waltl]|uniref:Uncharacterized protein n=1 Tax=Pleurodeles waltl TaxID=8319 RepID=A0AAV7WM04_PLEWA|nr:hypothetical protein NDU88_001451 [Pleurodeles waltl]